MCTPFRILDAAESWHNRRSRSAGGRGDEVVMLFIHRPLVAVTVDLYWASSHVSADTMAGVAPGTSIIVPSGPPSPPVCPWLTGGGYSGRRGQALVRRVAQQAGDGWSFHFPGARPGMSSLFRSGRPDEGVAVFANQV